MKRFINSRDFTFQEKMEDQIISTTQKKKSLKKYERFGEIIRHFTTEELNQLFDSIDNYKHKLMFEIIYELGCRVGEFVRIQVKHLNFSRSTVFFPAENTKTKHARISVIPRGLMNEVRSMLKQKGIITRRENNITRTDAYVFHPGIRWNRRYTENRIRQIFKKYVQKAGLQQVYDKDTKGRNLKMFTVHSLSHNAVFKIMPSTACQTAMNSYNPAYTNSVLRYSALKLPFFQIQATM